MGTLVFAQVDILRPQHPLSFSRGEALTAGAQGMMAFFYNPAAFAEKNEFNVSSALHVSIDSQLAELLVDLVTSSGTSLYGDAGSLPTELQDLVESLVDVGSWLQEADPNELKAGALKVGEYLENTNPVRSNQFDAGGSGEVPLSPESLLIAVLNSQIVEEDQNGDSTLTNLIAAIDEGVEETGGTSFEEFNRENDGPENWKSVLNAAVRKAKDVLPGGEAHIGIATSISYTGDLGGGLGLGIGLFANLDGVMKGANFLASRGRLYNTITLAGGVSVPLGPVSVGLMVRPTLIGYTNINPLDVISKGSADVGNLLSNAYYSGIYFGVDAGVLWDVFDDNFLTLGATVKDLLPIPIQWTSTNNAVDYVAGLSAFQLLGPNRVSNPENLYQPPPLKVNLGAQLLFQSNEEFWSWLGAFKLNLDVHDLFGFIRHLDYNLIASDIVTYGTGYEIFNFVRLGAEATLLGDILSARIGFGGGFLSFGTGLHLGPFATNIGFGLSDLKADYTGGELRFKQVAVNIEVALRF